MLKRKPTLSPKSKFILVTAPNNTYLIVKLSKRILSIIPPYNYKNLESDFENYGPKLYKIIIYQLKLLHKISYLNNIKN